MRRSDLVQHKDKDKGGITHASPSFLLPAGISFAYLILSKALRSRSLACNKSAASSKSSSTPAPAN